MPTATKFTLAFTTTHWKLLIFNGTNLLIMPNPSPPVNGGFFIFGGDVIYYVRGGLWFME
jgi:hypothetical protein